MLLFGLHERCLFHDDIVNWDSFEIYFSVVYSVFFFFCFLLYASLFTIRLSESNGFLECISPFLFLVFLVTARLLADIFT